MKYPAILNKSFQALKPLTNTTIVTVVQSAVANGMTKDILIGTTAKHLLHKECMQAINTGTYNFKKALLIRVKLVVDALAFEYEVTTSTEIDKNGTMFMQTVKTITHNKEPLDADKLLFNDPQHYEDYITLKGSEKVMNNNSTQLLEDKSRITMKIKEIDERYIDLYTVLLFEANNSKVDEPNYFGRLQAVAEETKTFLGYEYTNYRKLDSNSRNYPLNRYGFAVEYGDSFEKFLIEPAKQWLVTKEEIDGAIEYLQDEFKSDNYLSTVANSILALKSNLRALVNYEVGKYTDFTITHKELGKHLHIVDVYHNIIQNLGNYTTSCVSYDFTNSGGINASNQFGDKTFLRTMNLSGDKQKFDTHQQVADTLNLPREEAKGIMQGPNHGGTVVPEHKDMVATIFGPTYDYINMTAKYGVKLAEAGIEFVELMRPDGIKAVWYPYTTDCSVSMEDGSSVNAVMPYGGNGTNSAMGLAVSCLHSSDAFVEHYIQTKLFDENIHIKTTLDNFYGKPSIKNKVVKYTFEALEILRGNMEKQLKAIEKTTGIYRGWTLPDRGEIVESSNIM